MIDCREEQKRKRQRLFTTAAATSSLLAILVLWGISTPGSNLPLFASLPDSSDTPPLVPDFELLREASGEDSLESATSSTAVVRGPIDEGPAGLTVGERLKRLDSLMLVVPADSLEVLMAEYEELLDSALHVQYDGQSAPSYAREPRTSTPRTNEQAARLVQSQARTRRGSEMSTSDAEGTSIDHSSISQSEQGTSTSTAVSTPAPSDRASGNSENGVASREKKQTDLSMTTQDEPQPIRQEAARQRQDRRYIRSTPRSSMRSNETLSGTQPESASGSGTASTSGSARSTSGADGTPATRSDAEVFARRSNVESREKGERHGAGRVEPNRTGQSVAERPKGLSRAHAGREERQRRMKMERRNRTRSGMNRSTRSSAESIGRQYTEGLANFRAGDYRTAAELLQKVAASGSDHSRTARYYLALSLERIGRPDAAIRHYRALKRSEGSIGEKSWVSLARLMANSGQTTQARKELRQFTRARSSSRYVAEAKRLLRSM